MVSNIFYSHPENWGRFPFWRSYFSDGLKPPTSVWISVENFGSKSSFTVRSGMLYDINLKGPSWLSSGREPWLIVGLCRVVVIEIVGWLQDATVGRNPAFTNWYGESTIIYDGFIYRRWLAGLLPSTVPLTSGCWLHVPRALTHDCWRFWMNDGLMSQRW